MKKYLKLALAVAGAVVLFVLMLFTLATTSADMSSPSQPLRYQLGTDPVTLDINRASDATSHMVLDQLMEALYRYKPDGSIEPAGAIGYEVSGDGKVYTITLRADALWSDGVPVTAQHYVDGIIRLLDPATGAGYAWMMYFIEGAEEFHTGQTTDPSTVGVTAVHTYTLEITLTDPLAFFPSILAFSTTYPVRLDIIQSDPDWTEAGHFVGNGPYVLTKWDHGDELVVQKNPLYHDADQVSIEEVVFPIITDYAASLAAYESDLLDVSGYPSEELSRILADPVLSKEFHRLPRPGVYYLGVNTLRPPTDNPLVRKALAAAIDRQYIISDVLYSPWREYSTGVIPPEIPGYQGKAVGYDFDVVAAQQFLADAGYPGGEGFPGVELWYNEGNEAICESVASMWGDNLGITVTTVAKPWAEYGLGECRENPAECTYNAYRMSWVMDYGDANNMLYEVFHPDSPFQYTGWDNVRYRDLIDLGLTETDQALRIEYYQEAERILVEDEAAVIPLYFYDRTTLIKSDIVFEYPPFGAPHFMKWARIYKVYLPNVTKNYPAATVGLVVAGAVNDGSFNQTAWNGVQDAMAKLGVAGRYLESHSPADYEPNINEFIRQDYDLIITVGYLLGDATKAAAEANPEQKFTIVDYVYDPLLSNVLGQTYASDEAAFLAGYLAAGMTRTGKVATFGAIDIPSIRAFMVGYEGGVNYYNQVHSTNVEVLGTDFFIGSFSSDDGRQAAESLFDQGADILLPVAGPAGIGSAEVAQERGLMLIGVDTDWYISIPEFKETYLTSVLKKMDVAVFNTIKAVVDGTFEGGTYTGTLANDAVGIAPFHDFEGEVPEEFEAELAGVRQGIIDGTIDTGWPK